MLQVDNYCCRYGNPHPDFFPGSMDEALKASSSKSAKEVCVIVIPYQICCNVVHNSPFCLFFAAKNASHLSPSRQQRVNQRFLRTSPLLRISRFFPQREFRHFRMGHDPLVK